MRRGEVWWADMPQPAGARPVLLLSRQKAIDVRSHVTVCPLTRTVREIPSEVPLAPSDGVPKACAANLDTLQTIPKALLRERLCLLSPSKLRAVAEALKFSLDLP